MVKKSHQQPSYRGYWRVQVSTKTHSRSISAIFSFRRTSGHIQCSISSHIQIISHGCFYPIETFDMPFRKAIQCPSPIDGSTDTRCQIQPHIQISFFFRPGDHSRVNISACTNHFSKILLPNRDLWYAFQKSHPLPFPNQWFDWYQMLNTTSYIQKSFFFRPGDHSRVNISACRNNFYNIFLLNRHLCNAFQKSHTLWLLNEQFPAERAGPIRVFSQLKELDTATCIYSWEVHLQLQSTSVYLWRRDPVHQVHWGPRSLKRSSVRICTHEMSTKSGPVCAPLGPIFGKLWPPKINTSTGCREVKPTFLYSGEVPLWHIFEWPSSESQSSNMLKTAKKRSGTPAFFCHFWTFGFYDWIKCIGVPGV